MTEATPPYPSQPMMSPRDQKRMMKEMERERRRIEAEQRRAEEEARLEAARRQAVRDAADRLLDASGRGVGLVAFRNLEATIKRVYPQAPPEYFDTVLHSIGFDRQAIASPRFGYLNVTDGHFEIFRDYVIKGQEAYDVEPSTRGQVYVDGAIQVTQRVVVDSRGRQSVVNDKHDMRTAQIQFTSKSWALQAAIHPDAVPAARQYVEQLATHVDSLKPQQVSAADIRNMVDSILNNTGQPPAEKLRQLSNLRYEHLLSEDEFKRAKTKILDI